ncbi:MAG TPA: hypothetical protein VFU17_06695 [Candidatus Limnocylindrales bacterium]|nr:hypothetical protein [Candidatus Limnocylindrales bacterium]
MSWLRVAGTGRSPDGATVTWSVAEGRRGRRWREAVVRDGAVVHSLLFELDPDGRFAHLELTTPAGLLTLHPEGDGTLHGNAVTAAGITHVRGLPWEPDDVVLIDGSIVCAVVAVQWQRSRGAEDVGLVRVGVNLSLERERKSIEFDAVDGRGLPVLEDAHQWPLEQD